MTDFKLLINGKLEDGASLMGVVNPATEDVFAQAPRASHAQLDKAVAAANGAFSAWSSLSYAERGKVLVAIADILDANGDALAHILTQEQGKPLRSAAMEVRGTSAAFRHFATVALEDEIRTDAQRRKYQVRRKPLGAVGVILPWNYPLLLVGSRAAPALIAGNTVVLKPAPTTPLATLHMAALIKDALPPGVFNVIADANDLGDALSGHSGIRKVSFTGSTNTGRKVMRNTAETLTRITLELGGNDAAIVLDDVDPKAVAPRIFDGAFGNSGQVCIAMKRLYVHESIYDRMCDELSALAENAVVGDGLHQGTQFGPLQNKAQYEKVQSIIADARQHGTVLGGGNTPEKGYFIRPTIVRDIAEGTRLVDEEQFGPVLPVIKYSDPEDALARANASAYGLGGSVWSSDAQRAETLARRMDTGTVWINRHTGLSPAIPFAGAKHSGVGVEMGLEGVLEFTQIQVIHLAS